MVEEMQGGKSAYNTPGQAGPEHSSTCLRSLSWVFRMAVTAASVGLS